MAGNIADELADLFLAVEQVLQQNRAALNQADPINSNHGDHMAQIFSVAVEAARESEGLELAQALQHAAQLLEQRLSNGSARLYAVGLRQFAEQFRLYRITLDDLLIAVRAALVEKFSPEAEKPGFSGKGEALKALLNGLAGWQKAERGQSSVGSPLDMGALFEFGMAYLQAKQHGGSKAAILAEAAISASPLSNVPYRFQSGRLAVQALLTAMAATSPGETS